MLSSTPEYNFVFLTPEIAVTAYMLDVFLKMKCNGTISYIVIDECHCIDMRGFDFRPAYANLSCLTELNCQVIALTATCSPRTEDVILSSLNSVKRVKDQIFYSVFSQRMEMEKNKSRK